MQLCSLALRLDFLIGVSDVWASAQRVNQQYSFPNFARPGEIGLDEVFDIGVLVR